VILLVDDEAVVRRAAKAALQKYGYTVFAAADGRAGVDLFRAMRDRISLVLLDLAMPVMGGEEAYRLIKEIRPDVRVILSSGYDEQEAMRRFAGTGIDSFIQKPYTAAGLAGAIKRVLGREAGSTDGTRC
jgi:CheY-like chemotaxis protein